MPPVAPPRDPKLRPYRTAAWILYFAAIAVAVGFFAVSVVKTLRGRARRTPPAATSALPTRATLRVCMDELDALYVEQNQRAWAMGTHFGGASPLSTWRDWSPRWEERVADLSDRCRLDVTKGEWAAERGEMAAARDAMLALHRAYTAQVNRFADEHGDLARAAAETMAHAREAARPSK
jgi:hypothetical protein